MLKQFRKFEIRVNVQIINFVSFIRKAHLKQAYSGLKHGIKNFKFL
jgi:hypothetical protein